MAETRTLVTAAEFERLASSGDRRLELVRGEVVELSPPGWEHGELVGELYVRIRPHVLRMGGAISIDVGCWVAGDPDTVRGPDIAIVFDPPPAERRHRFLDRTPDIVIEVISPHDVLSEVQAKIEEYLAGGGKLVVLVEPRTRTVTLRWPDGTARILTVGDTLELPDLIPGFQVRVGELFEAKG